MKGVYVAAGVAGFVFVGVVAAALLWPWVSHGRIAAPLMLGDQVMTGRSQEDIAAAVEAYNRQLVSQVVVAQTRGVTVEHSLTELGVGVDVEATVAALLEAPMFSATVQQVAPSLMVNQAKLQDVVVTDFAEVIEPPTNASLFFGRAGLTVSPSASGEGIDTTTLEQDIISRALRGAWREPLS